MKLFKSFRTISVEVLYLTLAVAVGFAVLGFLMRTGAYTQVEGTPGIGAVARWLRSLIFQTYNP